MPLGRALGYANQIPRLMAEESLMMVRIVRGDKVDELVQELIRSADPVRRRMDLLPADHPDMLAFEASERARLRARAGGGRKP